MAITCLVRMRGGGIDSFLGFEYLIVITLASREFRVLTSLRCLRIFGFVGVAWCCDPTFIAYPLVRSLYWVLGICGIRPGYCCVGTIAAPILLLALRSVAVVAVFSPVSRFSS